MPRMKTRVTLAIKIAACFATIGILVFHVPAAQAINSVVVESRLIPYGATGQTIKIRLINDIPIVAMDVPLVIREITGGAFITSVQLSYAERLAVPGSDLILSYQYADEAGGCNEGSHPGFGAPTYSDGGPNPVTASPEGVQFERVKGGGGSLSAGSDVNGSLVLTVDVNNNLGAFEIDSTCTDPSNHLSFVDNLTNTIHPNFTKGTITVGHPLVWSLNESGPGSWGDALLLANSNPGRDSITFLVAGAINLAGPPHALIDPSGAVILGFTAPGAIAPDHPTVILDGTSGPGAGLIVASSFNYIEGLKLRNFNVAGVAVTSGVGNRIVRCHFYANAGPGIDLGYDGVTLNDPGDVDTGPNLLNNYPVFTSVTENPPGTFVLTGTASAYAYVELYLAGLTGDAGFPPDSSGYGPAYLYLASAMANPIGVFTIGPITLPEWALVTATSTDSSGNTSEFSENKYLAPDPMTFTGYSETPPPLLGIMSQPSVSPALQLKVYSPPDSVGHIDSIGPNFNTFGTRATYDSLTDFNLGGKPDSRVRIAAPDTGMYTIKYILIGNPGEYLTGIGIDGHAEIKQAVSFVSSGQIIPATYEFAPRVRGELNQDGVVDVFDVIASIDIVFAGAPMPSPPELIDVNCDALADVFDVIYLIDFAFSGGLEPCP
ncbi:MAG: hypothetical protein HZB43_06820 [candidate division Zixibacteria bacterium]|nr:hypothetical protein [candidate division Zixibacteria bacterium]